MLLYTVITNTPLLHAASGVSSQQARAEEIRDPEQDPALCVTGATAGRGCCGLRSCWLSTTPTTPTSLRRRRAHAAGKMEGRTALQVGGGAALAAAAALGCCATAGRGGDDGSAAVIAEVADADAAGEAAAAVGPAAALAWRPSCGSAAPRSTPPPAAAPSS